LVIGGYSIENTVLKKRRILPLVPLLILHKRIICARWKKMGISILILYSLTYNRNQIPIAGPAKPECIIRRSTVAIFQTESIVTGVLIKTDLSEPYFKGAGTVHVLEGSPKTRSGLYR
jgi:hypothetical protein